MKTRCPTPNRHFHPHVDDPVSQLQEILERLVTHAGSGELCPADFVKADKLLASLPLQQAEYAVYRQRLRNALQCHRCGCAGAARFELSLLRKNFERQHRDILTATANQLVTAESSISNTSGPKSRISRIITSPRLWALLLWVAGGSAFLSTGFVPHGIALIGIGIVNFTLVR